MRSFLMSSIVLFTVYCPTLMAEGWFDKDANRAVTAAHQAYLDADYNRMVLLIKEVLGNQDSSVEERSNMVELLSKAYDETEGRLPVDWRLPQGYSKMKFVHTRKDEEGTIKYRVQARMNMPTADSIANFAIRGFGKDPFVDPGAGLGKSETWQDEDGAHVYNIESADFSAPLPDGLYLFDVTKDDGSTFSGWFIMTDLTSTDSPELYSPAVGERLTDRNPTARWEDFRSPEYKAHEARRQSFYIVEIDRQNPEAWNLAWHFYAYHAGPTATTVGQDPNAQGWDELKDGLYWIAISYYEERRFGDLRLRRGSRTARHFRVDAD